MIKIIHIEPHQDFSIKLIFSDGVEKNINFKPFIGKDKLSSSLSDLNFFYKVKIYDNGRGIYWPNEFDFCPDYLHDYV
jgi:hypothetical protein